MTLFNKILIANRGEIACRIIRTAKKLNINTVAIFSAADRHALHVQLADEAFYVGEAPSHESYLGIDKIIALAKQCGANAIHPGYGFLSENAEFAEACHKHNIIFIGPSPTAIRQMGEKNTAKTIAAKLNIPTVTGYYSADQSLKHLQAAAKKMGYPVMIKAIAGGGGKGMRVVHHETELSDALKAAQREAKNSFNNDHVMLEKYIAAPRHIEMQIFADQQGHVVHLFERDCSIQRRHQKIIEEAPAIHLSPSLRNKIAESAIKIAQAIHYCGAGTVEFLVDGADYYFMEMNTRLQVEHPVTEMITHLDLVEWQIRVAAGENLPIIEQGLIKAQGHAIEVRLCAEDPYKNYAATTGTLSHCDFPAENNSVRIDTSMKVGETITPYYDSLIAKIICKGDNREAALVNLQHALAATHIIGINTNLNLLATINNHPNFRKGQFNTHFIEQYEAELLALPNLTDQDKVLAALAYLFLQKQQASQVKPKDTDSPWFILDDWRLNHHAAHTIHLKYANSNFSVVVISKEANQFELMLEKIRYQVSAEMNPDAKIIVYINNSAISARVFLHKNFLYIFSDRSLKFQLAHHQDGNNQQQANNSRLLSPMPGTIMEIYVAAGQKVQKGDKLIVIEAMKMEHTLFAPNNGEIKEIFYQRGDLINEGIELLAFEAVNS